MRPDTVDQWITAMILVTTATALATSMALVTSVDICPIWFDVIIIVNKILNFGSLKKMFKIAGGILESTCSGTFLKFASHKMGYMSESM